jgi:hypothetical protein
MVSYGEICKTLLLLESSSEMPPNDPNRWSEKEQIKYVRKKFGNIKNIKDPSETVQLAAIEKEPWAIAFISHPSEKAQLAAVQKNGFVVNSIKNPSETVQLAAVRQNPLSIHVMKNPTETVQLAAIEEDAEIFPHIKNPSPFVKTLEKVMNDEHLPKHQLIPFVEEALEKSEKHPFLLNILKEKGWI